MAGGGGKAAGGGIDFQARLGAWFAAHMIAGASCGLAFGLDAGAVPESLHFETGRDLDDVEARLAGGGIVAAQAKTSLDMSAKLDGKYAAVVGQVLGFDARVLGTPIAERSAAAIVLGPEAADRWYRLREACRAFMGRASWDDATAGLNSEARGTLDVLVGHVRARWKSGTPRLDDIARVARLIRVVRFDLRDEGAEYREAVHFLGAVYDGEQRCRDAMGAIEGVCLDLITERGAITREGMLARLRTEGFEDVRAGDHERDVARLRAHTADEIARLSGHRVLPVDGGVALARSACRAALEAAIPGGGLLVVGEPGGGKTGVLLGLAEARVRAGVPTVFLSVERHAGALTGGILQDDLGLNAPIIEVLERWPGSTRGTLLVDGLDASRGAASEAVFATLVEEVERRLAGRWSVVASIRTFDLIAGGRRRVAPAGPPPDAAFADHRLSWCRHVLVPPLSPDDLAEAGAASPTLRRLLDNAPERFVVLLSNAFNLSLTAALLADGAEPEAVATVETQSGLIDRYEDARLTDPEARPAVGAVTSAMAARRGLSVREADVGQGVGALLASGLLRRTGDRVGFEHNILFDHAVGRFHLRYDDPTGLVAQLAESPTAGFVLGPAVGFAMERMWRERDNTRRVAWTFARMAIGGRRTGASVDPIVASVVARSLAGNVASVADVSALAGMLTDAVGTLDEATTAAFLSELSRFVLPALAARVGPDLQGAAEAWITVAEAATEDRTLAFADGARALLLTLADVPGATSRPAFGAAARNLLRMAWDPPGLAWLAPVAIDLVGRSHATDPAASRALLERILVEPRFSLHAHEEAHLLADVVPSMARTDPGFVIRIYGTLFGTKAPGTGPTPLGRSRILPLRSTREQDYGMARYNLRRAVPGLLLSSPRLGVLAIDAALRGEETLAHRGAARELAFDVRERTVTITFPDVTPVHHEFLDDDPGREPEGMLPDLAAFLADASPETFAAVVGVLVELPVIGSVWACVLGAATARPGVADDALWPMAASWEVLSAQATVRAAVAFVARAHPARNRDERESFEGALLAAVAAEGADAPRARDVAARLASLMPEDVAATGAFAGFLATARARGEARGNAPSMTITTGLRQASLEDVLETNPGFGRATPEDAPLLDAIRSFDGLLANGGAATPDPALWAATVDLVDLAGRGRPAAAALARHHVARAVSRLAARSGRADRAPDDPDPGELAGLALGLSRPVQDVGTRREAIEAIARLTLSATPDVAAPLVAAVTEAIDDPTPDIRREAVEALPLLHRRNPEVAWALVDRVADAEMDRDVLAGLVGWALRPLHHVDPDRTEAVFDRLLPRLDALPEPEERKRRLDDVEAALGVVACEAGILRGRPCALGWIEAWVGALPQSAGRLAKLAHEMREILFLGYGSDPSPEDLDRWNRARAVLDSMAGAASAELLAVRREHRDDLGRAEMDRLLARHSAADEVLDRCCHQLFFGSDASKGGERPRTGLRTDAAKRRFLLDFRATLDALSNGTPRTIHALVKLYGHLGDAEPARAFDAVATVVVGGGAREGYQFERAAVDEVVRQVERYVADHRGIFLEDDRRQGLLLRLLDVFAESGWPEPFRLLQELPDLLR